MMRRVKPPPSTKSAFGSAKLASFCSHFRVAFQVHRRWHACGIRQPNYMNSLRLSSASRCGLGVLRNGIFAARGPARAKAQFENAVIEYPRECEWADYGATKFHIPVEFPFDNARGRIGSSAKKCVLQLIFVVPTATSRRSPGAARINSGSNAPARCRTRATQD